MASTSAVGNLKEELNCSICWNIYTEPVSLSCGHNFCRTCIENNWDKKNTGPGYSCPECRAEYAQKPVLQKNLKLSNIIERFEATQLNEEPTQILCDFCLDSPFPAVMTCMNCEASLCEHHLRKHSERAAQKNHLLIEPASSLEDRKCSDHEKLIEYYCLDDQSCICVTCYVAGSHKNHDIRILKDVYNEKKSSLSEKLEQLQGFRITLEQATKDLQRTEVNLKLKNGFNVQRVCAVATQKDSATLRKQISDLFQEIRMLVTKQEKHILDTIITEKNTNLSKVLKKIQELQIKREVVIQLIQGVQDLKNQKDPLFFIKDFKSTYERILNNDIEVETIKVIWKMLEETTIMTIKQETKRIFEMISKLILDHHAQPNDEGTEEMNDQNGEDYLSDYLKPTASEDVRRLQHTSLFCRDMPVPLVLERPVKSNVKVTSRGDQETLWSPELQLATSEQAAVTHVVEETVLRPAARLRRCHQIQVLVPQDLIDLNFQALFLGLQEAKDAISGDLRAARADPEAHVHLNFTDVHRAEPLDVAQLQAAKQSCTLDMHAAMLANLYSALQAGKSDLLSAQTVGLTEIQNALQVDMSNLWGTIHIGLIQVNENLQQMHTAMQKCLSQISEAVSSIVNLVTEEVLRQAYCSTKFMAETSMTNLEAEGKPRKDPYFSGFQDLLFLAPNAMSQEVMEETYQFDDYYEEDYLTEHMNSEDNESNASVPENFMYYTEFEEESGETPFVMEGSQQDEYMNVLYMRKRRDKVTTKSV